MRRLLSSLLVLTTACVSGTTPVALPGTRASGSDGGSSSGDGAVAGDLPCDVATLLSTHCTSCHGSPPSGNAPMSLNSLATLTAPATGFPGKTYAQRSLVRMQDPASPMPPGAGVTVTATEIAAFISWVDAGTPAGSCGPPVDPVFGAPPQCTSNSFWTGGNGSSRMHPGEACIACHAPAAMVRASASPGRCTRPGTSPTTATAPAAAGATVTVTDKNGTARSFTVNSAGNFYWNRPAAAGRCSPSPRR